MPHPGVFLKLAQEQVGMMDFSARGERPIGTHTLGGQSFALGDARAQQSYTIAANDQLASAAAYKSIIVAYRNNAPVLLSDVADVVEGLENSKVGAWYQGKPAIVIDVQRQPGANVIETVQRVTQELPRLRRAMPAGARLTVINDRTTTIRASVHDVQFTLVLSVALVVLVVLIFLRTLRATFIAGVALPLSLIATFGASR
jgi:multidrug efflux pump